MPFCLPFVPYVLPDAVPCGLVWLHPKCDALALSRARMPDSARVFLATPGLAHARYALLVAFADTSVILSP